jgi:hypothetical protein
VQSPALWGTEAHLRTLFGEGARAGDARRRIFNFRYRSADHFIDVFRTGTAPVHKAFASLPADRARRSSATSPRSSTPQSRRIRDRSVVTSEYLEVVATRPLTWRRGCQRRVQRYGWDRAATTTSGSGRAS